MGRQPKCNANTLPARSENALVTKVPLNSFSVRHVVKNGVPVDSKLSKRTFNEYMSGAIKPFGLTMDVWQYKRRELYSLVVGAFEKLNLLSILKISRQEFLAFVADVDRGYFDNPYHSFLHGFDIFQIVHYVLIDLRGEYGMSGIDLLAILIAALCHDLAHPGVNNLYQVHASTKLAIMYNDISVLENYSCSMTFALAAKHGIFRHLSQKDYESIRSTIIKGILATDISLHFDLREKFLNFVDSYDPTQGPPDAEHKPLILNAILHMADVSNPARSWELTKKWSDVIVEEFFLQCDLEKLNNLAPSPNMDRDKMLQPQIAIGFQDFIVQPFVNVVGRYLPGLSELNDYMVKNRVKWQALLEEMKRTKASEQNPSSIPDLDSLNLRQRRLSVPAGTVTIPGALMTRFSASVLQKSPSFSSVERINESDDDSTEAVFPWYPGLDLSVARQLTATALREPAVLVQSSLPMHSPRHGVSSPYARRSSFMDSERLLTKSVCLLQLSMLVLKESNDDAMWIFRHIPVFIKRCFSAHACTIYVISKTSGRLVTWQPISPEVLLESPDLSSEQREHQMKKKMLQPDRDILDAIKAVVTPTEFDEDNPLHSKPRSASPALESSKRAFHSMQGREHRLIVPILRQPSPTDASFPSSSASASASASASPALSASSSLPASPSSSTKKDLSKQPVSALSARETECTVGVFELRRFTAFGPAEFDLAACMAEIIGTSMMRARLPASTAATAATAPSPKKDRKKINSAQFTSLVTASLSSDAL